MINLQPKFNIDQYFRFVKNWDVELKKDLIIKLTQSINSTDKKDLNFSSCYGAWDDQRTSEQIIEEIKADRIDNDDIEEF